MWGTAEETAKVIQRAILDQFNVTIAVGKGPNILMAKWQTIDEYFTDVQVATAGEDIVLRYANKALTTQVEKLLLTQIHILKKNK